MPTEDPAEQIRKLELAVDRLQIRANRQDIRRNDWIGFASLVAFALALWLFDTLTYR